VSRRGKTACVSRSVFFAQVAERWLEALDEATTATINGAIAGLPADHTLTDAAASALVDNRCD